MPKKKAIEKPAPKPAPAPAPKPSPKPAPKPAPSDTDCFNAHFLAKRVIEFYKDNKGIFSKDKYLIKNKKELEEKIQFIKKILNDPRCENVKMTPPFRPFLEEALKLHLEKTNPKPKSNKQTANDFADAFFKMELERALKELKNVNKKDQQSVTNKIRKYNSFTGSLKNKIKKTKDLNLKKLMESVVSAHNQLTSKTKKK